MLIDYTPNFPIVLVIGIMIGSVVGIIYGVLLIIRKDRPPKSTYLFWRDYESDFKPQTRRRFNLIGGIVDLVIGMFMLIYCIFAIVKYT